MPTQRAMEMGSSSPVKVRDVSDMSFWRHIEAKYLARQVRGVSISEALMFKSNRRNLHVSAYYTNTSCYSTGRIFCYVAL